jgi:hypothetical protein
MRMWGVIVRCSEKRQQPRISLDRGGYKVFDEAALAAWLSHVGWRLKVDREGLGESRNAGESVGRGRARADWWYSACSRLAVSNEQSIV